VEGKALLNFFCGRRNLLERVDGWGYSKEEGGLGRGGEGKGVRFQVGIGARLETRGETVTKKRKTQCHHNHNLGKAGKVGGKRFHCEARRGEPRNWGPTNR